MDRERRPRRPLGVVLVRSRSPEKREEPVSGQLGDGAAEAPHLLAHQVNDLVEEDLRALWAERLADRGRAGDVGHEHRDDPPLAGGLGHGRIMCCCYPPP